MIGSGIYLLLFGMFMFIVQKEKLNKVVGVYNSIIGLCSLISVMIAKMNPKFSNIIFNLFCFVIVVSFVIFNVLKKNTNKN